MKYFIVSYKPNWVDYCRNCEVDRGSSDFEINCFESAKEIGEWIGSLMYEWGKHRRQIHLIVTNPNNLHGQPYLPTPYEPISYFDNCIRAIGAYNAIDYDQDNWEEVTKEIEEISKLELEVSKIAKEKFLSLCKKA